MGLLLKQPFDESFFFKPTDNPFFIRLGEIMPAYEGFVFSKQENFGDTKSFNLTNYTIKFKMYDEADQLSAVGTFDIIEPLRSKIEYKFQSFDTKKLGNYYVILEFNYNRSSVPEVLAISNFTVDYVASFASYTYGTGNYKVLVDNINLVSALNLIIDANDTNDMIATKINNGINAETLTHGYTSSIVNNKISVTAPVGTGLDSNNKILDITCDERIVIGGDSTFLGGQDPISSLQYKFSLPDKKDIWRIIIRN